MGSRTYRDRKKLLAVPSKISVSRKTEILSISRSSFYRKPKANSEDVEIMNAIDRIYTKRPFYGSRRIKDDLKERFEIISNRKKVRRLMRIMGIEAIYPKKRTSIPDFQHKVYPYLLRGVKIDHPNHVWSTDITYIRLNHGFAYLTALMDWYSRYVINWKLSNSLETDFCIENLEEALRKEKPEIHNSDQGCQYTSNDYTKILKDNDVKISMDSRGRYLDNIFVERLWRTVKYENVYIRAYGTMEEARAGLDEYFKFYNFGRRHSSLNKKTPAEAYFKN